MGTRIVVCGDNGDAKIISNLNGPGPNINPAGFSGGGSPASDCQYSPNGFLGAAFSNKVLGVNGFGTELMIYTKSCNAIDFAPNNSYAIVGCSDSKGYQIFNGS